MDNELQETFDEIRKLHQEYQNTTLGRKEIVKEIKKRINLIKRKTGIFNGELQDLEDYYLYRNHYINNYEQVMRLILRLANSLDDNYVMYEINSIDFINEGDETRRIKGRALVIGKKDVLEDVSSQTDYYYDEFSALATRIINKGHSMVIVTYNMLTHNVKPHVKDLHKVNLVEIKNSGIIGNISCYLHDDNLKKAVKMLVKYIDINGPDFRNIDEDMLYELIIENSKTESKTKKKTNNYQV